MKNAPSKFGLAIVLTLIFCAILSFSLYWKAEVVNDEISKTMSVNHNFNTDFEKDSILVNCDPYLGTHGFLDSNANQWRVFELESDFALCNTTTLNSNHMIYLTGSQSWPNYMRNKIVLTTGDSQDRYMIQEFCNITRGTLTYVSANGSIIHPKSSGLGGDAIFCVARKDGSVFVMGFIFHFGVNVDEGLNFEGIWKKHYEPGSPTSSRGRISLFVPIIKSVAGELFPEICILHGVLCKPPKFVVRDVSYGHYPASYYLDSIPGLVKNDDWVPNPDLIVAQSSLWDHPFSTDIPFIQSFFPSWSVNIRQNMLSVLNDLFPHVKNKYIELNRDCTQEKYVECVGTGIIVRRWFVRTTPVASIRFNPTIIHVFNMVVRDARFLFQGSRYNFEHSWGVLDWDFLQTGRMNLMDEVHQNSDSRIVYLNALFSKLEMLE